MILEVGILNVIPEKTAEFEVAFGRAQSIISSMSGYSGHQLRHCLEVPNRYIHHFYFPFPVVEHYSLKYENNLP